MPERKSKKVLILGATGPTGLLTVQKALEHNHTVTIYARNPSKVPTDMLMLQTSRLSEAIEGQDVIVSLLGPSANVEGTPFTDAYHLIFSLMKRWGVKRILAMGTPSITDPEDGFPILAFLGVILIRIIANSAYNGIVGVGKLFDTEATKDGFDWTIFRWGFLGNGAQQASKAGYVGHDGWVMKTKERMLQAGW